MKLHSLYIENFRAIGKISLDLTDYLGRPRPITLIVGPNSSGKTSILDAIHLVVKVFENPGNPSLRDALQYNVQQLVRGRGNIAKIIFNYSIEKDEAGAINDVYSSLNLPQHFDLSKADQPPLNNPVEVVWTFPNFNPKSNSTYQYEYPQPNAVRVLGARGRASQAVNRNLQYQEIFNRIGGVCYLDQRRSVRLSNTVRLSKNINSEENEEHIIYSDILYWLNDYYRKDLTWNESKYGESYWKRVKRLFNKICYPAELIGLESGPSSDTLILKRNGIEYDLYQMSSGEHQILRILVGLTVDTAKNSIVLIDEAELHLDEWLLQYFKDSIVKELVECLRFRFRERANTRFSLKKLNNEVLPSLPEIESWLRKEIASAAKEYRNNIRDQKSMLNQKLQEMSWSSWLNDSSTIDFNQAKTFFRGKEALTRLFGQAVNHHLSLAIALDDSSTS